MEIVRKSFEEQKKEIMKEKRNRSLKSLIALVILCLILFLSS